MNATPRPWRREGRHIINQYGSDIAYCGQKDGDKDAALIVQAVNTFDEAKAVLLDMARRYERDDCSQRREGNGVNVHVTASAFKAIKALLAEMEGK